MASKKQWNGETARIIAVFDEMEPLEQLGTLKLIRRFAAEHNCDLRELLDTLEARRIIPLPDAAAVKQTLDRMTDEGRQTRETQA